MGHKENVFHVNFIRAITKHKCRHVHKFCFAINMHSHILFYFCLLIYLCTHSHRRSLPQLCHSQMTYKILKNIYHQFLKKLSVKIVSQFVNFGISCKIKTDKIYKNLFIFISQKNQNLLL